MSDKETDQESTGSAPVPQRTMLEELSRLTRRDPDKLTGLLRQVPLESQTELALRLPVQERLAFLLHSPKPMRLVRSIPDADFYLTVREAGPIDAAPLLRLASYDQLQHLIDLESWRSQRFDADRSGAWVAMLLEADEKALSRFVRQADEELLAILLRSWVRVEQIEYEDGAEKHGHGISEAGTDEALVTPDGYYYFTPSVPEHAAAIRRLLQILFQEFPERYQQALWAAQWELPAELEEKALHWRQSRLEEHGFPAWEEALGIYAPPTGARRCAEPVPASDAQTPEASHAPLMLFGSGSLLAEGLERVPAKAMERALQEIASLANAVLIADELDSGEPAAHRLALEKAASLIDIALAARGAGDPSLAGQLLIDIPAKELFREGYAHVAALQHEATRLVSEGWPAGRPGALDLLDSPVREQVRALLEPRPAFIPGQAEDDAGHPRDFRTLEEIEQARVAIEMARVIGWLLVERLGLDAERMLATAADGLHAPRFSTAALTLLAWHATRGELQGDPLPEDVVADFLRDFASRRTASPDAAERALEKLIRELNKRLALEPRVVSLLLAFGRFCLEKLAEECSSLDPGLPVDRRFVSCLLLAD